MKEFYAKIGLSIIPRIISLLDKNMYSKTYGCFDKNYWHYRAVDFPSGTAQCSVLALALVYKQKFPGNNFYGNKKIKDFVNAGISFMIKNCNKDGSCDDYYPYERALGTTAFVLYSLTEAYLVLNEKNHEFERFFRKQADWILSNEDSGTMANHMAVAGTALYNVYLITKDEKYRENAINKIKMVLSLQSNEGWFMEYEGCDPGYNTITIDFLAKYYKKSRDKSILNALEKAINFCSYFMHPDGSFAGEYGSRGTYHFFVDGFEILGKEFPLGIEIVEKYMIGRKNGKDSHLEDDRNCHVTSYNFLQSYLDYCDKRGKAFSFKNDFEKYFNEAKIFVSKKGNYYLIISLAKGGVLKLFKKDELIYSDCGFIGKLKDGRVVSSQVIEKHSIKVDKEIWVKGYFNNVKNELMNPKKMVVFRIALIISSLINLSKLIKRILTKKMILGKKKMPIMFERIFKFSKDGLIIKDKIDILDNIGFKSLAIGSDYINIYVASAKTYQEANLKEWINLDKYINELNRNKTVKIERIIK